MKGMLEYEGKIKEFPRVIKVVSNNGFNYTVNITNYTDIYKLHSYISEKTLSTNKLVRDAVVNSVKRRHFS